MSKRQPPEVLEDLEDLYETAPCGYLSVSPDGRIVKANRTLTDWLRSEGGTLVGCPIHEILSFGSRIALETHIAPLLRIQGHVHEVALDLLDASGGKIPTIANAAEKRNSGGDHVFTRLTLFKAVDRRNYERSLVEARVKAEEISKAQREAATVREQFIAVLGHDLRNPLAATAAGVRMLQKGEKLTSKGEDILASMSESLKRASGLIDDVLDFARGSLGGGFSIDPNADAPLAPVLNQVVSEIRAIYPERVIEAQIAIEEPVFCDRGRLGQLASNLLSNALSHGSPDKPIGFEAITDERTLRLSVSNAGEPIPDVVRKRLFQPFFRGDVRPSRNGLGLGLFIVSEIARAHKGALNVISTEKETRFIFEMQRGLGD